MDKGASRMSEGQRMAALAYLRGQSTARELAKAYGVSERTITRWAAKLAGGDVG